MEGAACFEWVISPPLIQSTDSLTAMPGGLAAKLRVNMNNMDYVTSGQKGRGSYQSPQKTLPLVIMPFDLNIFLSGLPLSLCDQASTTEMEGLARHPSDILSWLEFLLL